VSESTERFWCFDAKWLRHRNAIADDSPSACGSPGFTRSIVRDVRPCAGCAGRQGPGGVGARVDRNVACNQTNERPWAWSPGPNVPGVRGRGNVRSFGPSGQCQVLCVPRHAGWPGPTPPAQWETGRSGTTKRSSLGRAGYGLARGPDYQPRHLWDSRTVQRPKSANSEIIIDRPQTTFSKGAPMPNLLSGKEWI